ncbi:MAG: hypothetical protein LBD79_02915, partial [Treponema sp.]|nr:hypothetical protein [Treponema sp.]
PAEYFDQPAEYFDQPAEYFDQPAEYFDQPAEYFDQPAEYLDQPAEYFQRYVNAVQRGSGAATAYFFVGEIYHNQWTRDVLERRRSNDLRRLLIAPCQRSF